MATQLSVSNHFNSGEWSPLMSSRADLDKYSSSLRKMYNFIPAPQGAALCRQGTAFIGKTYSDDSLSALIPFQYSNEQSIVLEFSKNKIRFLNSNGFIIDTSEQILNVTTTNGFLTFKVSDVSKYAVGKTVSVKGLPISYGLNEHTFKITAIDTTNNIITTDEPSNTNTPDLTNTDVNITLNQLVEVDTPYSDDSILNNIRHAQKNDIMYLFLEGYKVQKLSRYSNSNWTLAEVQFIDGPYLDENTTGNNVFLDFQGGAVKSNFATNMQNNRNGTVTFTLADNYIPTGYQIIIPSNNTFSNTSTIFSSKDMEPTDWQLMGSVDGVSYEVIDTQTSFLDYNNYASDWFPIKTESAFKYYKLNITNIFEGADIPPNVQDILITTKSDKDVTATFTSTTNINNDNGFISTDVGRSIRIERSDGTWVPVIITSIVNETTVTFKLVTMPFLNTNGTGNWRLGLLCDTIGYPSSGIFFGERLYMCGFDNRPATIVGSVVGNYENFQISNPVNDNITDSDSLNLTLETQSKILWVSSDDRGIVLGTSSGEYVLQGTNGGNITPASAQARNPSQRGSANVDIVKIDHICVSVDKNMRSLRNISYSFEIDGYSSTDISLQASHLGQPGINRLAYCSQPNSSIYALKNDGTLLSCTYMQDQQVNGFSQIDIADGFVESICSIPSSDYQQDTLYLSVKRTVNGVTKRTIERLLRTWDFNMNQFDVCMFDCAYVDTSLSSNIYGLKSLANQTVYALIDGCISEGPYTVNADGTLTLSETPQTQVVIGLPYLGEIITQNVMLQSQNGPGLLKLKRLNRAVLSLYATGSGKYGVPQDINNLEEMYPLPLTQQFGAFKYGEYYSMYGSSGNYNDASIINNSHKKGDVVSERIYSKSSDDILVDYSKSNAQPCAVGINGPDWFDELVYQENPSRDFSNDPSKFYINSVCAFAKGYNIFDATKFTNITDNESFLKIISVMNSALQQKASKLIFIQVGMNYFNSIVNVNDIQISDINRNYTTSTIFCKLVGSNGNNIKIVIPPKINNKDMFSVIYTDTNGNTLYKEDFATDGIYYNDVLKDGYTIKLSGGIGDYEWILPNNTNEDYSAYDLIVPDSIKEKVYDEENDDVTIQTTPNEQGVDITTYTPIGLYKTSSGPYYYMRQLSDTSNDDTTYDGIDVTNKTDNQIIDIITNTNLLDNGWLTNDNWQQVGNPEPFILKVKDTINKTSKLAYMYGLDGDAIRFLYKVKGAILQRIIISVDLDDKYNVIIRISLLDKTKSYIMYQERYEIPYPNSNDALSYDINIANSDESIMVYPMTAAQQQGEGFDEDDVTLVYSRDIAVPMLRVDPLVTEDIELQIPGAWTRKGNITIRKDLDDCLPLNIIALNITGDLEDGLS